MAGTAGLGGGSVWGRGGSGSGSGSGPVAPGRSVVGAIPQLAVCFCEPGLAACVREQPSQAGRVGPQGRAPWGRPPHNVHQMLLSLLGSTLFDAIGRFSTLFDIRRYSTLFDAFRLYATLFDAFRLYATLCRCDAVTL